jgi:hypothetical protein
LVHLQGRDTGRARDIEDFQRALIDRLGLINNIREQIIHPMRVRHLAYAAGKKQTLQKCILYGCIPGLNPF